MASGVEQFVDQLRQQGTVVRAVGQEYRMLCPNPEHPDKKPSLYLNRESGQWNCFGCGIHGNLFSLGKWFDIRVSFDDSTISIGGKAKTGNVPSYDPDEVIENYFLKRQYTKEQFAEIERHFKVRKAQFGETPLAYFPIWDFYGNDIGWLMRHVEEADGNRYILKRGFKSLVYFYGEWAVNPEAEELIVVEGAFDLFRVWSAGCPAVLASLGYAEPNQKIARAIKRLENLKLITLLFDSDVKDKDLDSWLHYIDLFGKASRVVKLQSGDSKVDPDSLSIEQIKSLVS